MKIAHAFLFVLAALLLGGPALAQAHKTGTELLDMVVPYGDDNCFNRTSTAAQALYISGTHAHLKAKWGYEFEAVSAHCDVFFREASTPATGTGTHLPIGARVTYRIPEAYLAFWCEGATRVNVCHLVTDLP